MAPVGPLALVSASAALNAQSHRIPILINNPFCPAKPKFRAAEGLLYQSFRPGSQRYAQITTMVAPRFVATVALPIALVFAMAAARAEEPAQPSAQPAEHAHVCLNQKERHAELETGKFIKLTTAIRAAGSRMPGTVVQVRLCRGQIAGQEGGLVYVLTVLAHDGKVARIVVDAVKGTLVGGL
jgi:uncharacterized membrane protein YkoI